MYLILRPCRFSELILIHTTHLHDADLSRKAYYNFPNHNVPFFPLAGPWARGVALITPGNNRSEYATGWDEPPDISEIAGERTRHTVEIKSLEGDSRGHQTA